MCKEKIKAVQERDKIKQDKDKVDPIKLDKTFNLYLTHLIKILNKTFYPCY